jgi:hypothetical protein
MNEMRNEHGILESKRYWRITEDPHPRARKKLLGPHFVVIYENSFPDDTMSCGPNTRIATWQEASTMEATLWASVSSKNQ